MIVATAGHVDHGKTSLVRGLTGVETDRLEEEQRRGLSINLGYAYLPTSTGMPIGFIDVPGHRSFINTMIAGVSGIDLGMIIVAADDGPMPQTREHIDVMHLLGVQEFLIVITKCDRADAKRIKEVSNASLALLQRAGGQTLTPRFQVSNINGDGVEDLRNELLRRATTLTVRKDHGLFRMSVDRAFSLQGHGLVVTGTAASGQVSVGDSIVLHPQGEIVRVRSIRVHDRDAKTGNAGERCALNLVGNVHRDDIERGDWVTDPGCVRSTSRIDCHIGLLNDAPFALKNLADVKLHIGAKQTKAKLLLLAPADAPISRLNPGESSYAQVIISRPVHCCHGDRFLLRDFGETATLGGGIILDPHGAAAKRTSARRLSFLSAMEQHDIEDAIRSVLSESTSAEGLDYKALLQSWNHAPGARPGDSIGGVARIRTDKGETWFREDHWATLQNDILITLRELHKKEPREPGFRPSQVAQHALGRARQALLQPALVELLKRQEIRISDGLLSVAGHTVADTDVDPDWSLIAKCLQHYGRSVPTLTQIEKETGLAEHKLKHRLGLAQRDGKLTRINTRRFVLTSTLREFAQAALDLTADNESLAVATYRDHLGCGRNVAVDVLEYFDGIRFTRRVGETRIIVRRSMPERFASN